MNQIGKSKVYKNANKSPTMVTSLNRAWCIMHDVQSGDALIQSLDDKGNLVLTPVGSSGD